MIELFVFYSQPFLLSIFFHAFKDKFFSGNFLIWCNFSLHVALISGKMLGTGNHWHVRTTKNFLSPPMKNFKFKLFKFVFCIFFWCLLTIEKSLFLSTEWYWQIAHIDKHVNLILKKCSCSFKRAVIVKWSPHQTGTQEVGSPKP